MNRADRVVVSIAVLGLLALSTLPVQAAEPAWTYVEGGYTNIDLDDLDDEGDGYFVGGSFGLAFFHFFGRFTDNKTDDSDLDIERRYAGIGWHGGVGPVDLLAEAAYVDAEFGDEDDSGYFVRGGVRFRPIKLIEVGGFARYEDLGDLDDDVVWEANALLYIWRLGIGASYETQDEVDTINAFVRFNFGLGG